MGNVSKETEIIRMTKGRAGIFLDTVAEEQPVARLPLDWMGLRKTLQASECLKRNLQNQKVSRQKRLRKKNRISKNCGTNVKVVV